jgi:hypothetical protein
MALYDTKFGLPQSMVDYLNQGLPSIQQPYRPGYDKNYGPGEGMAYTTVMPQPGYQYVYGPDGRRYSIPIPGYDPNENADIGDPAINPIEKLSVPGGNEKGFSVYNPDPNMTRTSRNYVNPFPYDPMDDFGTSDYGYVEQPRKGIQGFFDQYVKGSIPAQLIGKTVKGLANMLPVNRTGIMQNELLGAGFALDNIGRIVAAPGKYNTPEGIMAGYNLAAREQDFDDPKNVFNKRDTNIRNTLKNKYNLDDKQIDQVLSEIEEEGEYKGPFGYNETLGKTTNLFENLFNINKARNIIEDKQKATDIIFNRKVEERKEKALEKQNQERIARETRQKAEAARKNQTYTGGSDRQNVVDRNTGRRDATGGDRGSRGASDQFSNRSGRGRTGY